MQKIIAIAQLIIGVIVVYFAFTMFYQALVQIAPSLKFFELSSFPSIMTLSPVNKWLQLITSIFMIQVIAVYTKGVFDRLSVNNK